MGTASAKNNTRVISTPLREPKVSIRTSPGSKYPIRSPLIGGDDQAYAPGPSPQEKMFSVLKEAGCPLEGDIYNPLFGDKETAVFLLQAYVDAHGFFPTSTQLDGQGLSVLRSVMRAQGGATKMKGMVRLPKKPVRNSAPKKKKKNPRPKPEPAPEPSLSIYAVLEKPEEGLDEFVCLEGELSPSELKLVMHFLNSTFEKRMLREGDNETYFLLSSRGLKIPVEALGTKLYFRKGDIPALLLVAELEAGSSEVASDAIEYFCREVTAAKVSELPKLGLKIWAAREYWLKSLDSKLKFNARFSERAQEHATTLFNLRKLTVFFAETGLEYRTEMQSPKLRRQSTLLNDGINPFSPIS